VPQSLDTVSTVGRKIVRVNESRLRAGEAKRSKRKLF
jgi:hypothetical protein